MGTTLSNAHPEERLLINPVRMHFSARHGFRQGAFTLLLVLTGLLLPHDGLGQAGMLDPTFGTGGIARFDFGAPSSSSYLAIQPDGKIIVGGQAFIGGSGSQILARLLPDGSLDASFGTGGIVVITSGSFSDIALQSDGGIIASLTNGSLSRYLPDGTLDVSISATTSAIVIQPDDKILKVGKNIGNGILSIERYNPDLTPDTGFGTNGATFPGQFGLQPDGKIVFVERSTLKRLNADGSLDMSFGNQGQADIFVPPFHFLLDLAIQSDGKVVLFGFDIGARPALIRFSADGTLDQAFGTGGVAVHENSYLADYGDLFLAFQPNGKIVVSGHGDLDYLPNTCKNFLLAQYHTNGSPDDNFGNSGLAQPPSYCPGPIHAITAREAAVQPDGRIVLLAWDTDFTVMRYIGLNPPQDEAAFLLDDVQDLIDSGSLNKGQGNTLINKLDEAIVNIEQGKLNVAVNKLNDFISQVNGFVNAGKLTAAEGSDLASAAEAIINQLQAAPAKAGSEVGQANAHPETYALSANYPNPFNPSTEILFDLPRAEAARLTVYDALGREVARLVDGALPAGTHRVRFEAGGLPSGVYVYRLTAGAFTETRRMVLLR